LFNTVPTVFVMRLCDIFLCLLGLFVVIDDSQRFPPKKTKRRISVSTDIVFFEMSKIHVVLNYRCAYCHGSPLPFAYLTNDTGSVPLPRYDNCAIMLSFYTQTEGPRRHRCGGGLRSVSDTRMPSPARPLGVGNRSGLPEGFGGTVSSRFCPVRKGLKPATKSMRTPWLRTASGS
jgi:hypothetical protein